MRLIPLWILLNRLRQKLSNAQKHNAIGTLNISADEALNRLLEGNRRFAANKIIAPNRSEARRYEIVTGQHPFAIILGCVDSRVPPELIFDQGLGDLFVIRSAGQVTDDAILGSIEFGVAELGIPLIMVLGHTKCGAVTATIETLEKKLPVAGAIGTLVENIKPAVERASGHGEEFIDQAARMNVALVINRLKESPILSAAIDEGKTRIVGAFYDLSTGLVEVMDRK
jgi:carbonic anhydrase